ncbi:TetR/AcrR family transcriptional regulator [Micromonospora sp. NPDC050397]|uniref:TetR/AcrR family transcriptional regulator n=1 Tax=Micromonospora sp. NPDC050397 TaxID=3364279 RepID=UPI00384D56BC
MSFSPRRPSLPVDRRAKVEAAILAATERLLSTGVSFTELGIGQIAAEAGIARPTFYLYFRDKTELMLRLVQMLGLGSFEATSDTPIDLEAITQAYRESIAFFRERKHVMAAIFEVAGYDEAVRQAWESVMDRFVQREVRLLRAEQSAGRTPADLDPETAAEIINWGGSQLIVRQVTSRGPERDESIARELAELQFYGFYRRPAGRGASSPSG